MRLTYAPAVRFVQGSKRELEALEKAEARAAKKAAVEEKKAAAEEKKAEAKKAAADKRDPKLPTSVPMPSAVADITVGGMRAMWEGGSRAEAAPVTVPVMVSVGGAAEVIVVEGQVA